VCRRKDFLFNTEKAICGDLPDFFVDELKAFTIRAWFLQWGRHIEWLRSWSKHRSVLILINIFESSSFIATSSAGSYYHWVINVKFIIILAEYACPVCNRSAHTNQVDTALNETCRIATGCMKPRPLPNLYREVGFAAPTSRRKAAEHIREDQANCRWATRTLRSQNTTEKIKIAE
jgi:hypothetical protein